MSEPRTLYEKVWDRHVVSAETAETPAVLYVDLHLVHEVTSPQAFAEIERRGLTVRRPDRTFATLDHSTPTLPAGPDGERPYYTPASKAQVETLERNCARHGVSLAGWDSDQRGVVHVMGPELGLTQPGMTVVCGDSHTATHGAFGALAFGIGTSEVGHVLATQCLLQRKAKTLRVTVDGTLAPGVSGKDVALAVIAALGFGGGTGYVIEYAGEVIRALDMEGRMTLCNMSIEAGAGRASLRIRSPSTGCAAAVMRRRVRRFERAATDWLSLASDPGAVFDKEVRLDGDAIRPMATWGTTPDAGVAIGAAPPEPRSENDRKALAYMGFEAGRATTDYPVDVVFIGSCTNGRLPDLRAAAAILKGRRVKPGVRVLVVPGSEAVRRDAEAEGLHTVFTEAGAEWRIPGCSMCLAMNGDMVGPGQLAVSTSNRNFEGRQGPGARTILASPATAAASAVMGVLTDPRVFMSAEETVHA
ncbi:LOW QUALITY PROTEIN: 3-isopropylmalate dehydratase large subunit [Brevundimonas abyssalis TAR-001]|uniref:3-isopropylmalate dehydratase n=1 Tax=Brevundimonas abyssalis TAR-001 TaxID=1391729 RepID=A0A8E0KGR1_9CAUL|nr:LOW QUALITY PROTEIN: 3-isopropylmalate dehydratase large subunit [Brevundimonas abyssalis TAR-001]